MKWSFLFIIETEALTIPLKLYKSTSWHAYWWSTIETLLKPPTLLTYKPKRVHNEPLSTFFTHKQNFVFAPVIRSWCVYLPSANKARCNFKRTQVKNRNKENHQVNNKIILWNMRCEHETHFDGKMRYYASYVLRYVSEKILKVTVDRCQSYRRNMSEKLLAAWYKSDLNAL